MISAPIISYNNKMRDQRAFTLIELLVVIGIIGVLAAAVILFINPAEILNRTRDSARVQDLQSVNDALRLYQVEEGTSFGAASTTYISIPDTSATCANLTLPGLPPGWSYNCVTDTDLRKVDGNGWIPVDFTSISGSSPLSKLPIDPINSDTDSLYYSYVTGGSWALSAILKSDRELKGIAAGDGGTDDGRYEIGSNLSLWTQATGLVGYWKLDGNASDSSGNGNDGTVVGGPTWTTSCQKGGCLDFDGVNDRVDMANESSFDLDTTLAILAWINWDGCCSSFESVVSKRSGGTFAYQFRMPSGTPNLSFLPSSGGAVDGSAVPTSVWTHVAVTFDNGTVTLYQNAQQTVQAGGRTINNNNIPLQISGNNHWFDGAVDEVRVYNRALSESEIKAIYTATK